MGLDPLSVIAPARVRVLVLPVGRIVSARFLAFIDRLQLESIVRLGDVTPDGRPHRSMIPSQCLSYQKHTIKMLTMTIEQLCSRLWRFKPVW